MRLSSAPCATTPIWAISGTPAVTGAGRRLRPVEGNGAAVDFRGDMTRSEGVVWGQVVGALRDDDAIRRRCADTGERTSTVGSVAAGAPAAQRDRLSRERRRRPDIVSSGEIQRTRARSPAPVGDRSAPWRRSRSPSCVFRRTYPDVTLMRGWKTVHMRRRQPPLRRWALPTRRPNENGGLVRAAVQNGDEGRGPGGPMTGQARPTSCSRLRAISAAGR